MTKFIYEIVERDGGQMGLIGRMAFIPKLSPAAPTRARRRSGSPASRASREDRPKISYEDKEGRWHDEWSSGHDRPETEVEG
jgi:hypothetical protein